MIIKIEFAHLFSQIISLSKSSVKQLKKQIHSLTIANNKYGIKFHQWSIMKNILFSQLEIASAKYLISEDWNENIKLLWKQFFDDVFTVSLEFF